MMYQSHNGVLVLSNELPSIHAWYPNIEIMYHIQIHINLYGVFILLLQVHHSMRTSIDLSYQ